ncbi:hypothetical protein B0H14DRAFT_3658082 [Mycena olivaceomarginata]|nr:hypothetical protein B0H14DRAFT_3658082 [Mycena olivaceomarginata]
MSYSRTIRGQLTHQTKDAKQEPEYEVAAILDTKVENNNVEYLVKWTEYGPGDNSWVLASDAENAPSLIKDYLEERTIKSSPSRMAGTKRSRKSFAIDVDERNSTDGSPREENAEPDPEYEVDAILDAKVENNTIKYLVKWTEYGPEDNSWVLASDAENAPSLIKDYLEERTLKSSPSRLTGTKRSRKSMVADASDVEGLPSVAKKSCVSHPRREDNVKLTTGTRPASETAHKKS